MDEARIAPSDSAEPGSRSAHSPGQPGAPRASTRVLDAIGFALGGAAPADDVALAWSCATLPLIGFVLGSAVRAVVWLFTDSVPPVALAGCGALGLWLGGGRGFAATAV